METAFIASVEQVAIYNWFRRTVNRVQKKHLVVIARAGCGKTSTIVEAVGYAPERNIVVVAFNVEIKNELKKRVPKHVKVMTLHGMGYSYVMKMWPDVEAEDDKHAGERAWNLALAACGSQAPEYIVRLVAKLHTKGREIRPHARSGRELLELAETFELEPDPVWWRDGYDVTYVCDRAAKAMEIASVKPADKKIDFTDMIFLPLRNGWVTPRYDLGVCDEAQDMNEAQLEMFIKAVAGRICLVGDDKQAIYAFRGADVKALSRLKEQLDADELGLKTSWRCGTVIGEKVRELVPDFQTGPNNPVGEVQLINPQELIKVALEGDFIVSRLNAPNVSIAISLLRAGKRARVRGKDIGKGLLTIIDKLTRGRVQPSIETFMGRLEDWREKQTAKWREAKRQDKIDYVNDQADMIMELSENAETTDEVRVKIEALFVDKGLGDKDVIMCSSVHKAKGLEAKRVFVLEDTLYPRGVNDEEKNIHYVAITRAKESLFMVSDFYVSQQEMADVSNV